MIYEIRTYTIRPSSTSEVERRWGEAYKRREQFSKLSGYFHTEVGPLNEVIQIWPYESLEHRAEVRKAVGTEFWPPNTGEFIFNQKVEIATPFPFAPEWKPGKDGPLYEFRQYTFRGGSLGAIQKAWEASLTERMKFSAPVLLASVDFGPSINSFIHIWPYKSMEQRAEVRAKSAASGHWPPAGGPDYYLLQSNKFMLPSAFSPAQ